MININIVGRGRARHRADPKTRIERFRNADRPRRARRGGSRVRSHGRLFFFLRDVRRVTLLFDSMGEMGFLTSRSPRGEGVPSDRGLRPEASIIFDRPGHRNRGMPRCLRSSGVAEKKRGEITSAE